MPSLRIPLRVVFYKEDSNWVAHCLEFDLVGCGATKSIAFDLLSEAIGTQLEATANNTNLKNLFCPAAGEYLNMFAAGKDVIEGALTVHAKSPDERVIIESIEVREFDLDCEASRLADLIPA